jgi:hypothetical protein
MNLCPAQACCGLGPVGSRASKRAAQSNKPAPWSAGLLDEVSAAQSGGHIAAGVVSISKPQAPNSMAFFASLGGNLSAAGFVRPAGRSRKEGARKVEDKIRHGGSGL